MGIFATFNVNVKRAKMHHHNHQSAPTELTFIFGVGSWEGLEGEIAESGWLSRNINYTDIQTESFTMETRYITYTCWK